MNTKERQHLEDLLLRRQRNLFNLEKKAADYGSLGIPTNVINEIENERAEIKRIESILQSQDRRIEPDSQSIPKHLLNKQTKLIFIVISLGIFVTIITLVNSFIVSSQPNQEPTIRNTPIALTYTPLQELPTRTLITPQSTVISTPIPTSSNLTTTQVTNAPCPPLIQYGQTIQCEIKLPNERHEYTFSATKDDVVQVIMKRKEGLLEPQFTVFGPDNSSVFAGSPREPNRDYAQAGRSLPNTGIYTIRTQDGTRTKIGSYTLTLILK